MFNILGADKRLVKAGNNELQIHAFLHSRQKQKQEIFPAFLF